MQASTAHNSEVKIVEDNQSVTDILMKVRQKSELDSARFRMACTDPRASR